MESIKITRQTKNECFFITDGHTYRLITPDGEYNPICIFGDKMLSVARSFADKLVDGDIEGTKEQQDYFRTERLAYWSKLFHLSIWQQLSKNNTVTAMFNE